MYQSGCEPADTCAGLYGPHSQIGLIWTRPPSAAQTPKTMKNSPVALRRERREEPVADDVVLGAARAGELGVLLLAPGCSRCTAISASRIAGISSTWTM